MAEKKLLPNVALVGAAPAGSAVVVPAAVAGKLDMKSLALEAVSGLVDGLSVAVVAVAGATFAGVFESELLVNCMLAGMGARTARESGIRVGAEPLFLA